MIELYTDQLFKKVTVFNTKLYFSSTGSNNTGATHKLTCVVRGKQALMLANFPTDHGGRRHRTVIMDESPDVDFLFCGSEELLTEARLLLTTSSRLVQAEKYLQTYANGLNRPPAEEIQKFLEEKS